MLSLALSLSLCLPSQPQKMFRKVFPSPPLASLAFPPPQGLRIFLASKFQLLSAACKPKVTTFTLHFFAPRFLQHFIFLLFLFFFIFKSKVLLPFIYFYFFWLAPFWLCCSLFFICGARNFKQTRKVSLLKGAGGRYVVKRGKRIHTAT